MKTKNSIGSFLVPALILLLVACTGITTGNTPPAAAPGAYVESVSDAVPGVSLKLCLLKDNTVSCEQVEAIVDALTAEMAAHGINLTIPWIRDWQRPGFAQEKILRHLAAYPLESPCDRLLALVGRGFKDFAWGLLMPEVLGAVETLTRTKGFVVAEIGSLNQLLTFKSPAEAAVHELYHMLGCNHGDPGDACADRIRAVTESARRNFKEGWDFFPAMDAKGNLLITHSQVQAAFGHLDLSEPLAQLAAQTAQVAICEAPANANIST